jgi:hypothetical protein
MLESIDAPPDMPEDKNHGGDYWRFTPQGIALLMRPFQVVEILVSVEGGLCFHGIKA